MAVSVVSLFSSKARKAHEAVATLDATSTLRSANAWQLGQIATLGLGSELTALAYGASLPSLDEFLAGLTYEMTLSLPQIRCRACWRSEPYKDAYSSSADPESS